MATESPCRGNPENIHFPPAPCTLQDGNPCDHCKGATDLEVRIRDVKAHIASLKLQRLPLPAQINASHDPFTSKLPPEVISTIFKYAMVDDHDEAEWESVHQQIPQFVSCAVVNQRRLKLQYRMSYRVRAPIQLGTICWRWRQIAWRTPQLWTNIAIALDHPALGPKHVELFNDYIGRSGNLPLRLTLSISDLRPIPSINSHIRAMISAVLAASHRVVWLDVQLSEPILQLLRWGSGDLVLRPKLQRLDIYQVSAEPESLDLSTMPLNLGAQWNDLRMLVLRGMHFNHVDIGGAWAGLTRLHVRRWHICEVFDMLRLVPRLEHLVVAEIDALPDEWPASDGPIVHSTLRYLHVDPQIEIDASMFFEGVALPGLEELRLTLHDVVEDHIEEIFPASVRLTLRALTRMTLWEDTITHLECDDLVVVFRDLPSLEFLEFSVVRRDCRYYDSFLTELEYTNTPDKKMLLPNLKELCINFGGDNIADHPVSWKLIPKIFGYFLDDDNSDFDSASLQLGRPLKTLLIKFWTGKNRSTYIDRDITHQLISLMAQGITLDLRAELREWRYQETDNEDYYDILESSMDYHQLSRSNLVEVI